VTEQPEDDDREPPRLQDTTERSALPLPIPGSDEPETSWVPPEGKEEPAPADESASVEEPAPSPNGSTATEPQYDPWQHEDPGPRPEVLIGAAFVGGLALALLIRRLGR
jgi:hypothetical protein